MNKKRTGALRAAVLGAILGSVVAIFSVPSVAQTRVVIGTGGSGGTSYFIGNAMAQLINKYSTKVRVEVLPLASSIEITASVMRQTAHLGFVTYADVLPAMQGSGRFTGLAGGNTLRVLWGGYVNFHLWTVRAESNIHTLSDLRGKTVGLCPKGSACQLISTATLEAAGLRENDYRGHFMSFTEEVSALQDRKIDAAAFFGAAGSGSAQQASNQMAIRFLPVPKEIQQKVMAVDPTFVGAELPAKSYRGQTDAVPAIGTEVVIVSSTALNYEAIAEMSDILFTHRAEMVAGLPLMEFLAPDNPLNFTKPLAPRHEGWLRYAREKNLSSR